MDRESERAREMLRLGVCVTPRAGCEKGRKARRRTGASPKPTGEQESTETSRICQTKRDREREKERERERE
jgi:hypothetical protein